VVPFALARCFKKNSNSQIFSRLRIVLGVQENSKGWGDEQMVDVELLNSLVLEERRAFDDSYSSAA
jgi:hypothetical protein